MTPLSAGDSLRLMVIAMVIWAVALVPVFSVAKLILPDNFWLTIATVVTTWSIGYFGARHFVRRKYKRDIEWKVFVGLAVLLTSAYILYFVPVWYMMVTISPSSLTGTARVLSLGSLLAGPGLGIAAFWWWLFRKKSPAD